ncbi:chorismate--pyruvate lyase family protein [Undibacterium jejuense]|nr:chorismate lyase [Undibacterium jejuense]
MANKLMRDVSMPNCSKAIRRSALAHWVEHVNTVETSPAMQDWLCNRNSLTARLVACCQQFRVQRLSQKQSRCLVDEFVEIGLSRPAKVHEREVLLRCDGVAMIYGHTVVPLSATASQWPLFRALGEKSLGSTLFNDPLVKRGVLSYARLHASHPLLQRIKREVPEVTATSLPARRSLFWRKGACLLVTEVFLPTISSLTLKEKAPLELSQQEPLVRTA